MCTAYDFDASECSLVASPLHIRVSDCSPLLVGGNGNSAKHAPHFCYLTCQDTYMCADEQLSNATFFKAACF